MHKRSFFLLFVAAIAGSAVVAPKPAQATVNSSQYVDGAPQGTAENAPLAQTSSDELAVRAPAWTATRIEESAGFTEAAMAYDPSPDGPAGSGSQNHAAVSQTPSESSVRAKIPEPSTLVLFGTVLIGIGYLSRKRFLP